MYNYYSGVYRVPRHVLLEKIFTLVVVKIHLIQEPTQYWEHNGSFLLVAWWNLYIQQVWIRWGPDRPHGPWYLRVAFYTFLDWQPATYLNNIYAFLNYRKCMEWLFSELIIWWRHFWKNGIDCTVDSLNQTKIFRGKFPEKLE